MKLLNKIEQKKFTLNKGVIQPFHIVTVGVQKEYFIAGNGKWEQQCSTNCNREAESTKCKTATEIQR